MEARGGARHHLARQIQGGAAFKAAESLCPGIGQCRQSVDVGRNYQVLEVHLEERRLSAQPSTEKPALYATLHAARRLRLQNARVAVADAKVDGRRLEGSGIV